MCLLNPAYAFSLLYENGYYLEIVCCGEEAIFCKNWIDIKKGKTDKQATTLFLDLRKSIVLSESTHIQSRNSPPEKIEKKEIDES